MEGHELATIHSLIKPHTTQQKKKIFFVVYKKGLWSQCELDEYTDQMLTSCSLPLHLPHLVVCLKKVQSRPSCPWPTASSLCKSRVTWCHIILSFVHVVFLFLQIKMSTWRRGRRHRLKVSYSLSRLSLLGELGALVLHERVSLPLLTTSKKVKKST